MQNWFKKTAYNFNNIKSKLHLDFKLRDHSILTEKMTNLAD